MNNFNRHRGDRGGRQNDRRGGFNRGGGFNRDREVTMHSAVCDACQQDCQVPFKPTNTKPIYCSSCFEQKGGGNRSNDRRGGGRDRGPRFEKKDTENHKDILKGIKTLNYKLDQLIEVLIPQSTTKEKKDETKIVEKKAPAKKTAKKKVVKKKATKKKVVKKKATKKK